jgi:hypothetical protein
MSHTTESKRRGSHGGSSLRGGSCDGDGSKCDEETVTLAVSVRREVMGGK